MSSGSSAGDSAASGLKSVAGAIHGSGEAIRGNINSFVDSATGDKSAAAKHQSVADKGVNEVKTGNFNSKSVEPTTQSEGKLL